MEAVKMVQQAGIMPGGTFILGLPPETPETVRETVAVYKEINKYRTHVNKFFFATPYPGTALYDQMKKDGRIKDEIKYFELLSSRGDAVDFVINCTNAFTDEDLIRTKEQVEQEVFNDFILKHPLYALSQFVTTKTFIAKIRNVILTFKMKGFKDGAYFVWHKFLAILKIADDPYKKRWTPKKNYSYQQTLLEGQMVTY